MRGAVAQFWVMQTDSADLKLAEPAALTVIERVSLVPLTDAVVETTLAVLRTAEVKTQDLVATADKRARQGMRDLVVHRAAVLRVRMTDNGAALERAFARTIKDGLETARRAVDEQGFGDRVF